MSNTEYGYLNGVTSAIQTRLDTKHDKITSSARLDAALISTGTVSNAEFAQLADIGTNETIQSQLDKKAALASPDLTGTPTAPTAAASTNSTRLLRLLM